MKTIFLSLSLFAFLFSAQLDVLACSCPDDPDTPLKQIVKARLATTKAVFSGEVLEIREISQQHTAFVKIKIRESWKGNLPQEIIVATDFPYEISCGYGFQTGKSYLVFADGSNSGNLRTHECTGNGTLENAAEELKILGKHSDIQTNAQDAALAGNIYNHQGALIIEASIKLIDENGKVYQSASKEEGYQLNVPTGVYSVEINAEHYETFRIGKYRITPTTKGKQLLDIVLTMSEPPDAIRIK